MLPLLLVATLTSAASGAGIRGWNSWYSYFGSSNESQTLEAAAFISSNLLAYGYDTITLDEGWAYADGKLLIDENGLPAVNQEMFPHGMPWLAAQLRKMGIKLGLWVIRGVPRAAAAQRLPILGSEFTCDEAARYDINCSWSSDTFGSNAPSQAAAASSRLMFRVTMGPWRTA